MVTVSDLKEDDNVTDETLREERRRTGRYVATVIAIFVSLFGLYQALARGTPEYAAFFLPALIMFFYILWILYASRKKFRHLDLENIEQLEEIKSTSDDRLIDISEVPDTIPTAPPEPAAPKPSTSCHLTICRTYSVA